MEEEGAPLLDAGHDVVESHPAPRRRGLMLGLLVGINTPYTSAAFPFSHHVSPQLPLLYWLVTTPGGKLLNYLDRYTIAGFLPELKDPVTSGFPHQLSDSQGGLLMTVFICSYMIFSPIFGYFGDRTNRVRLITVGIIFWSIFTVAGSFATNYGFLAAARAMVGIGEASYATIAPTLISDLYHVKVRTTYLAIFYLAIPVGSAMGFIVGGQIAVALGSWRWALRISPPLGLLLALMLFFFTQDPPRGLADGQAAHTKTKASPGLRGMLKDIKQILRVKSFIWNTLGFCCVSFAAGALAQWAPTLMYRQSQRLDPAHSYTSASASLVFGGITAATGVGGTILGSVFSRRWMHKTQAIDAYICAMGMLGCVPFMAMALPVTGYSMIGAWVLIFLGEILLCLNWAPTGAITLYVIPPEQRATAGAINILATHLLGDAFSPYLAGAISDTLQKHGYDQGDALMYALFSAAVAALLGGMFYLRCSKFVVQDKYVLPCYARL